MVCNRIDIWSGHPYDESPQPGFRPVLDTYLLDGAKTRGAVLVLPGGGYSFTSDREGEPIATRFAAAGYHAFVLWYSVAPHRHPQPIADVARALCVIREHAQAWNLDPDKIAVIGFSAGGHLASSIAVHWDKPWLTGIPGIRPEWTKPNALLLSYPVISSGPYAHRGSFDCLLGEDAPQEALDLMSSEKQVGGQVPPTFLWHTFSDGLVPVENTLLFAQALRGADVPFELHVYPDGFHGLSTVDAETCTPDVIDPHVGGWMKLAAEWLDGRFR